MLGKHLFGIYEKAFGDENSWKEKFSKAKSLGFDCMELSIDPSDIRLKRLYLSDHELDAIAEQARQNGICIESLCLSAHRKYPFGSADPEIRKRAYDIMLRAIHMAHRMGIRVILYSGYDVYYEKSTPDSMKRFLEGTLWASEEAEKYQVMLGMETMNVEFTNSLSANKKIEEKINSPWFKSYLDFANVSAWNIDVREDIRKNAASIVGCHVKDTINFQKNQKAVFEGVPYGEGCVDFSGCFKTLEEVGYKGPYVMEMWHKTGTEDTMVIDNAVQYVEQKFKESF